MKSLLAVLIAPLAIQSASGADILTFTSSWSYLLYTDPGGNQIDPASADPDFYDTWYLNEPTYNGPAFTSGAPGPYAYDVINYYAANGLVPTQVGIQPVSGTRGAVYFKTNFDLGANTLTDVQIEVLSDDGFILALDGNFAVPYTSNNMSVLSTQWNNFAASVGSEDATTLLGFGTGIPLADIGPGAHAFALSLHQQSVTSSDVGLAFRLTGTLVPVPEPATTAFGLVAAGLLAGRRRRA